MFPTEHEKDKIGRIICTEDEYKNLADWQTEEVKLWNAGEVGQNGAE